MFNKEKIKELEARVNRLTKRVWKLENTPKYKLDDEVSVKYGDLGLIDGCITDRWAEANSNDNIEWFYLVSIQQNDMPLSYSESNITKSETHK